MYSLPSRSHRRHPFAFFMAIGYGSKYFTPAVTPPGRERRARSAYARDAFVLAARSVPGSAFVISSRHPAPGRYSLRGPGRRCGARCPEYAFVDVRFTEDSRWLARSLRSHIGPWTRHGIPAFRARNPLVSSTP